MLDWGWMVNAMPQRLSTQKEPLWRRQGEPQGWSGWILAKGKSLIPPSGIGVHGGTVG